MRLLLIPALLAACDAAPTAPPPDPRFPDPAAYDVHAADRDGCRFGAGDTTEKTIGPDVPRGDKLPFDHVVVLMMENRSFDHYFSKLPQYGVTDVDVASDGMSNPDPLNADAPVYRFHESRYCVFDSEHEWADVHTQWDGGLCDGFVTASNPGGARAMGYYDQTDIPFYYWAAKTFAISDRHFSSTLGPTWPNRFYLYGATSWGRVLTPDPNPPKAKKRITELLEDAGRSWQIYHDGLASFAIVFGESKFGGVPMTQFDADVANNSLPDVSFIDPNVFGPDENDEHPPSNIQLGQKFVARVVGTLMSNPEVWKKTVLFVVYDEHGGYFDHVAPPPACVPDDLAPPDGAFDRYGFRVPLMAISPFAKAGYVSHHVTDHASITRFIENRFGLPALTHRDANAWPLLDLFDFNTPPFVVPPADAPSAEPLAAGLQWCATHQPGNGQATSP